MGLPRIAAPGLVTIPDGIDETSAQGIDEFKQLFGTDPQKRITLNGLRIPALATNNITSPAGYNRYLFLLDYLELAANTRICITGLRQMVDIGVDLGATGEAVTHYPMVMPVTSPDWCFSDANISWHLMGLPIGMAQQLLRPVFKTPNALNAAFQMSKSPALLWQTMTLTNPNLYVTATAYQPPNGGLPWGTPITPDLDTFYDLRFPRKDKQEHNTEIYVDGAKAVALFASVKQTNPATRPVPAAALTVAGTLSSGIAPEEAFLINFPNAIYWKVGGAILWKRINAFECVEKGDR